MIAEIRPSRLHGVFSAPPSKSMMQRACALALMHKGETKIEQYGQSADDKIALSIIQSCGAIVQEAGNSLIIKSKGVLTPPEILNCGESGLSLRMFSILLATQSQAIQLHGIGSLLHRNISDLMRLLHQVGVDAKGVDGRLPVSIQGPLRAVDLEFDANTSSQYLTGLLFALAFIADRQILIKANHLVSKGYVSLSIDMLQHFGYDVQQCAEAEFLITPRSKSYNDVNITIEGDWSGAAFFLVWGAIHGGIAINGLQMHSSQPDRAIMEVFNKTNASFEIQEETIVFHQQRVLTPFYFDATNCPDLFPPLAIYGACIPGMSVIKGAGRLKNKESDRSATIVSELGSMGVDIKVEGDDMIINGGNLLRGAIVNAHQDHRIAMATSMLAMSCSGQTIINGAESVNKSYPDFFKTLQFLGADVSLFS